MNANETPEAPEAASAPAPTAGAILAHARHAAGLSIDDVAVQLKLAPRQVVALEHDDFAALPGRTFIRGFTRNYARLLRLDVDGVLDALPGELGSAPGAPSLAATSRAIGEMPRERASRPGIARWLIPLILIAIVAGAAYYEFARPPAAPTPEPAAPVAPPPAVTVAPVTSAIPLDNPVRPPPDAATTAPTTAAPAPSTPATDVALASQPAPGAAAVPAAETIAAPVRGNQLVLRFRGTSWVEVRDRNGGVVLSMTGSEGASREIAVATPADVTIGNAAAVDATWRGRPLDVAALSRQNVARFKLD